MVPVVILTRGLITTECKLPFSIFNIISFVLVASYAVFTLFKLRKRLECHLKIMGALMVFILLIRLVVYLYIPFVGNYCH